MPKFRVHYDDPALDARSAEIIEAECPEDAGRAIMARRGRGVRVRKVKAVDEAVMEGVGE